MDTTTDDLEDPFNYSPLRKKKTTRTKAKATASGRKRLRRSSSAMSGPDDPTKTQSPARAKKNKTKVVDDPPPRRVSRKAGSTSSPAKKQLSQKTKVVVLSSDSDSQPTRSGTFCVYCQIPLDLLSRHVSTHAHLSACLETSFNQLPPCPDGERCDNTIPSHFVKFDHAELAESRARVKTTDKDEGEARVGDGIEVALSRVEDTDNGDCDNLSTSTKLSESLLLKEPVAHYELEEDDDDMFASLVDEHLNDVQVNVNVGVTNERSSNICEGEIHSPIKISARGDSDELSVQVEVDPSVSLRTLKMRIPAKDMLSKPFPVECQVVMKNKVSPTEAKEAFAKIMGARTKKPDPQHDAYGDAKRKGYIAPSFNGGTQLPRACPFYKLIPGTTFAVDAFSYGSIPGVAKYFLSHFHYDHYNGLTKNFKAGTIVCSEVTARLLLLKIKVLPSLIRAIPLNETVLVDDAEVTLLDANHCPGAVMLFFRFPDGRTILHCGDFRAVPAMEEYPVLWSNRIDTVYLDTTYCKEEYDFPSQADVIASTVNLVQDHLKKYPNTLVLVGSYTIGKERIFVALAEALGCKVWASTEKARILRALQDETINLQLTINAREARIHVMEMRRLRDRRDLLQYMELLGGKYDHILTISPTGWTHSPGSSAESSLGSLKIRTSKNFSSLDVPYSEHSSFSELRRFVQFLSLSSAEKVIPTVNVGSQQARNEMKGLFSAWISDKKKCQQKTPIFKSFLRK